MAKRKKSVKSKKKIKRSIGKSKSSNDSDKKRNLAVKNLILFTIILVVSWGLYSVSGTETYQDLFFLLSILSGFVAIAFLIVLLIFVFMKAFKK